MMACAGSLSNPALKLAAALQATKRLLATCYYRADQPHRAYNVLRGIPSTVLYASQEGTALPRCSIR